MQNNDLQPRDKRYDMAYAQQMSGHVPADIYHIAAEFQARSVHPANPAHSEEKRIIDRTVEFCITRNIRNVPDIYILDSDIPNAASVSGNHMIMTTAILEGLSPEKLDAIIGHELSHHRHSKRDVIAQGAIGLVGGSIASLVWPKKMPLQQHIPNLFKEMLHEKYMAIPAYFGSMIPLMQYRHFMEYEADKEGAELTSPSAMASALHALETHDYVLKSEATQANQSLGKKIINTVFFPFTSHPKTEKRLARINAMPEPSATIEKAEHQQTLEQPELSRS